MREPLPGAEPALGPSSSTASLLSTRCLLPAKVEMWVSYNETPLEDVIVQHHRDAGVLYPGRYVHVIVLAHFTKIHGRTSAV